jgi:phosphopantothenoylcysteine decarboxylase/phosphopantothenate--cysteine ligase
VTSPLAGRTIALVVTGSIAAYKSVAVARLLIAAGARVIPVMTASASRFVGAITFAGITGESVRQDMWDPSFPGEVHVSLAAEADLVLVVPATADALARFASGRADDLVSALVLCAKGHVLAAPAMHPRMWSHPATQANVETLERHGRVSLVGPANGPVASGDEGEGRMAEPAEIVKAAERLLTRADLAGVRIVVTAGPTQEALDPVRYVGNKSSGIMGFRVAERAAARGAVVTLIAGPVALPTPPGVTRVDVTNARAMGAAMAVALGDKLAGADALVMAAAVADFRPKERSPEKLKRHGSEGITLDLVPNADLLAEVGAARAALGAQAPYLVGFALETAQGSALVARAREKLAAKQVDVVIANTAAVALGGDDSAVTIVTASKTREVGPMSKLAIADEILDLVKARLASNGDAPG